MSINLILIDVIVLFYLIYRLIKLYKWHSIIHPGLIFGVIWIISVPSYLFMSEIVDFMIPPFPEYVDELNFFVLFTAICFYIFSFYKSKNISKSIIDFRILAFSKIYKKTVMMSFISVFLFWIALGASFNLGSNRTSVVEATVENFQGGGSIGALFSILAITQVFLITSSIFAGYSLARWVFFNVSIIKGLTWQILPLLSYLLYSAAIGGRNPLFWGFKYYIIGFGLGCGFKILKKNFNKFLISLFSIFFLINVYSTFVVADRVKFQGFETGTEKYWKEHPFIGNFSGLIEYLSFHYMGYQYRRDDYVDEKLTLGSKSFGGILKFQLPLSNLIGLDFKLGDLLDKEYNYDIRDIMYSDVPMAVCTSSTYMLLYDDFGFVGTLFVIVILVYLTQRVYINLFKKTYYGFISIIPIFLLWAFWSNTIFDSFFSINIIGYLYPFFVLDAILPSKSKNNNSTINEIPNILH